jgi:hypothetical protein
VHCHGQYLGCQCTMSALSWPVCCQVYSRPVFCEGAMSAVSGPVCCQEYYGARLFMLPGHDECSVRAGTTMPSIGTGQYVARPGSMSWPICCPEHDECQIIQSGVRAGTMSAMSGHEGLRGFSLACRSIAPVDMYVKVGACRINTSQLWNRGGI